MPRFLLIATVLAVVAAAPAAADNRSKADGYKTSPHAEHRDRVKKREAKARYWKRYRHGKYYYYYPYSRWWGPFVGPPGL